MSLLIENLARDRMRWMQYDAEQARMARRQKARTAKQSQR